MNLLPRLSFATLPPELTSSWARFGFGLREKVTLVSALGGLTLVLFLWAAFIRKRRRRRSRYEYGLSQERRRDAGPSGLEGEPRRRRRRRRHRPRNPTLAETGGLPPVRQQEQQETAA